MGQEEEQKIREKAFADYQVTEAMLDAAHANVIFCIVCRHRGEEVNETILDDPRSRSLMKPESSSRSKALMEFLVLGERFPEPV